jgi:hypothetical protein
MGDGSLWCHFNVASLAMEGGTKLGINNLKAIRDRMNGWHFLALFIAQASNAALAAVRTP